MSNPEQYQALVAVVASLHANHGSALGDTLAPHHGPAQMQQTPQTPQTQQNPQPELAVTPNPAALVVACLQGLDILYSAHERLFGRVKNHAQTKNLGVLRRFRNALGKVYFNHTRDPDLFDEVCTHVGIERLRSMAGTLRRTSTIAVLVVPDPAIMREVNVAYNPLFTANLRMIVRAHAAIEEAVRTVGQRRAA